MLVIALTAIALTGIGATAAHASFSECTNDGTRMCVWKDANGGGGAPYQFGNSVFPGCVNIGGAFYDQVSSMKMMRLGAKVKFYYNGNCVPTDFVTTYFLPVSTYNFPSSMNDHVRSFYWTNS